MFVFFTKLRINFYSLVSNSPLKSIEWAKQWKKPESIDLSDNKLVDLSPAVVTIITSTASFVKYVTKINLSKNRFDLFPMALLSFVSYIF